MIAGRSEVVDIFRRWATDRVPIRWQGGFSAFAFASWGLIMSVDDREVHIESRDRMSELTVQFAEVIEFDYADSRSVTGEEKRFDECIIIRFSEISDAEDTPDTIAFGAMGSLSNHDG